MCLVYTRALNLLSDKRTDGEMRQQIGSTAQDNPIISNTTADVPTPVSFHARAGNGEKCFRVFAVMLACLLSLLLPVSLPSAESAQGDTADLVAPVDDALRYPFTKDASLRCGRWKRNSQDYPYFGAPRNRNARKHAGIDIYPAHGEGTPVKAMKAGKVVRVALFFTRANGEKTYGVLIDHGDFAANYAELKKPEVTAAQVIEQGQTLGRISGTGQLHLEFYAAGTTDRVRWYGDSPQNLLDPTPVVMGLLSEGMKLSNAGDRYDAESAFDHLMSGE
jgi:murein DD-endopeptidase MepM/ murein hydrolase activator NlpD